MVVVRLVVLVPLVARVHTVEVARLAWPVLVVPPVDLHTDYRDDCPLPELRGVERSARLLAWHRQGGPSMQVPLMDGVKG